MKNIKLLVLSLFLTVTGTMAQVTIDADDSNISYWGRVDHSSVKSPSFEYSGVTIKAQFTGTSISAILQDYAAHGATTTNYFYKIIDGGTPEKFEALAGTNTYELATGLAAGTHTVELVKLTEANVGKTAFKGFVIDNGASLQPLTNQPVCEIEFIGNSITCGYGNEATLTSPDVGFHSINENNYKAWGYVAARNLGMRYKAVSYSGRGMYRNNTGSTTGTIPKIYDRIFPDNSSSPSWDHQKNHPSVIVINLGTNDFALDPATPLDEALYKSTYVSFVETLLSHHPNATIICATGVMMSDGYPAGATHWTRITTYVQDVVNTLNTAGHAKVHYFQMNPQSSPYGEDWHPTIATHNAMATQLTTFINGLDGACDPDVFEYAISNWYNRKKAAVALTFDDFSAGHPGIVVPELQSRDIQATFNIVTSNISNWNQVRTVFENGNEVANHTKTHSDLTTLTATQISEEVRSAKNMLEQQVSGLKVLTLAYPFGTNNAEVIDSVIASEHIGARGVQPYGNYGYNFAPTETDYFKLLTYSMVGDKTITNFTNQINNVVNGGGFLNYLYHSVYSETVADNNYAQVHQTDFEAQLDALVARKDEVWISTFAQAIQYHREKKSAELTEVSAPFVDGDTWKFILSDELRDDLYFQALTVGVKVPSTVNNIVSVEQNGNQLEFSIDGNYLWYNAIPDAGEIIVNISNCVAPEVNLGPTSKIDFCIPTTTTIYAEDKDGNTYEWFKDGVSIGTGNSDGSIAVSDAGSYTVNITNNACTVRSSILGKSIVLTNIGNCGEPRVNFEINTSIAVISQVVTLTNLTENSEETAVFEWRFNEPVMLTSTNQVVSSYIGKGSVEIQYQSAGDKTIELFVSGSIQSDSITKSLTVVESLGCLLEDNFENTSSLDFLGGWNNYKFSIDNSNLNVQVPADTPDEWYAFTVLFNDGIVAVPEDFSQVPKKPVIKFRVRASDTLTLKVSLIDGDEKDADGSILAAKNQFDITTEYQEFELDMSGLLLNQWDEIILDSTQITGVVFRINSGYKTYPFKNTFGQMVNQSFVGTLELDWVGVNDDCDIPEIVSTGVKNNSYNPLKLYPNPMTDVIYIESEEENIDWIITNLSGTIILSGNTKMIDVSELNAGLYFFNSLGYNQKIIKN